MTYRYEIDRIEALTLINLYERISCIIFKQVMFFIT